MLKNLLLLLLFLSISGATFSQSSAELKRRKTKLTREIAALKKSQSKIASTKRLSIKQINVLNTQIRLREEKIETINSEVKLLNNQISESSNTVHSLQKQLNRLKKEYAAMLRFAHRNRSAYNKLMFVFASNNFNQAYKRIKYLRQFGDYRKRQAKYIQDTQRELGVKIVELDQNKRSKNSLLQSQEEEKITLSKEKSSEAVELRKLTRKEQQVRQQVGAKQKESARLTRSITAAIKKEIAAARAKALAAAKAKAAKTGTTAKPVSKGSSVLRATPESAKLSSNFLSNRGRLPWPVSTGVIVSRYGVKKYGNVTIENNGIDIKTAEGAAVRAVFSGDVLNVSQAVTGYLIIIRHGEYFSVYSNLKSVNVSKGQKVSVKQSIGTVIKDPIDKTTQLHFEIYKGVNPSNPELWLTRN